MGIPNIETNPFSATNGLIWGSGTLLTRDFQGFGYERVRPTFIIEDFIACRQ